jgi:hypothetical protein
MARSMDYEATHYPVLVILLLLHLSEFQVFSPAQSPETPSINILHLSVRTSSERKCNKSYILILTYLGLRKAQGAEFVPGLDRQNFGGGKIMKKTV